MAIRPSHQPDRTMIQRGIGIFLLFLTTWPTHVSLATISSLNQGQWTTGASAPTKRTEVAVAAVNGKIYVVGGFSEPSLGNMLNFAISNTIEEYDPATDHWTTKAPLPIELHHAGAVTYNGTLYVIGGFTKSFFSVWHPIPNVYRYDPKTDEWTELAPMPTARGALAVAEVGGRLYAIGGYNGAENPDPVEAYNPNTNSWNSVASLPTPRDHLTAVSVGRHIYAIGGRVGLNYHRNVGTVEAYDPRTNTWRQGTTMPTPRSGITAGVIDGQIYVLGGESGEGTFEANERYFPHASSWHKMAPLPTARHGLGSAVVQGRLYVISGGPTPGGSFSNVNEVFSPPSLGNRPKTSRASAQHVSSVMALLATFQEANVLPPEASPEANQLIRALIQFQSAFMKSRDPAINRLFSMALEVKFGDQTTIVEDAFRLNGWTSEALEAVADYANRHHVWDNPDLPRGFRDYNLNQEDFDILTQTFYSARHQLDIKGQNVHAVYAKYRERMPGNRP